MSQLFLIAFVVNLSHLALASSGPIISHCEGSAKARVNHANTNLTLLCLRGMYERDPGISHITATPYLLSTLAQMCLYSNGILKQKLLEIIELKNNNEIRSVLPHAIKEFHSDTGVLSLLDQTLFSGKCDILSEPFKISYETIFNGKTKSVDFHNCQEAANQINYLVNKKISKPAQNLVSCNNLDQDTGLTFISTYKFMPDWGDLFVPTGMVDIDFNDKKTGVTKVSAVHAVGFVHFAEIKSVGVDAVLLPLRSSRFWILLVKPHVNDGIPALLDKFLHTKVFTDVIDQLEPKRMSVYAPIGEISGIVDLGYCLKMTNVVTEIFDADLANFTGVLQDGKPAKVSHILEKVHLKTNRGLKKAPDDPDRDRQLQVFKLDFPFAYFVVSEHMSLALGGVYYPDKCNSH